MRAWELYENDIMGRRESMRRDPVDDGYYVIYRACPANIITFSEMDYVTASKKFAIEHAEHMFATEEVPYHVIRKMVTNDDCGVVLFNAPNTGELFYDGPTINGKEIYQADGIFDESVEKADLPDIEVGDELRTGKFKNRKVIVKGFKKDKNNHPVAKTTMGDVQLLKPRVTKLMPKKLDESMDFSVGLKDVKVGNATLGYGVNDRGLVSLQSIRVPQTKRKVGAAKNALNAFVNELDRAGLTCELLASPLDKKTGTDGLVRLYQQFGFELTGQSGNMVGDPIMTRTPNPNNLNENSHQDDAESYAKQHGMEITWEGSGDMGEAYVTDKDTIIKVTTDKTEMSMATKLVGQKMSNVADIYDVQGHIIHMELLDVSNAEAVYNDVSQYDNGDGVEYIDPDDHPDMSEEAIKMIQDLSYGIHELGKNGIQNLDIKGDNLGQKPNGDYAFFDMSDAKRGMW